jgi:hypothetical protein
MSADAAQALTGMHEAAAPSAIGFHWSPARDTWVAALSYLAVVAALALAFQVFTVARVAANFITYGVIALAGLGVAFPALYTVLVRKRPLADLGLTTRLVAPSLLLGIILGFDTYRNTVATLDVTWSSALVPIVAMTLAVGLFEAVFFRGCNCVSRMPSVPCPDSSLPRCATASTTPATAWARAKCCFFLATGWYSAPCSG